MTAVISLAGYGLLLGVAVYRLANQPRTFHGPLVMAVGWFLLAVRAGVLDLWPGFAALDGLLAGVYLASFLRHVEVRRMVLAKCPELRGKVLDRAVAKARP